MSPTLAWYRHRHREITSHDTAFGNVVGLRLWTLSKREKSAPYHKMYMSSALFIEWRVGEVMNAAPSANHIDPPVALARKV